MAGRPGHPAICGSISPEHDDSGIKKDHSVLLPDAGTRTPEFLIRLSGNLVSDGYQPYHTFSGEQALASASCWTHCRRRFVNAIKAAQKDLSEELKNSIAYQALARISAIYRLDESWKEKLWEATGRTSPEVPNHWWTNISTGEGTSLKPCSVRESEEMAKLSYSIHQEKYLKTFLEDESIPSAILPVNDDHPFCVGRKNWNVIDTVEGAQASAIAYSIAKLPKQMSKSRISIRIPSANYRQVTQKKDSSFSLDDLMPGHLS